MKYPVSTSAFRKTVLALLLTSQMPVLTACGGQAAGWEPISSVTSSSDGLTLTAEITLGKPKADGKRCRRVVGTEAVESASQVIVGIQTRNFCDPGFSFPWEEKPHTLVAYPFNVDLRLKTPLAGRQVLEKESQQRVKVK
jgi:hypothetical protein